MDKGYTEDEAVDLLRQFPEEQKLLDDTRGMLSNLYA